MTPPPKLDDAQMRALVNAITNCRARCRYEPHDSFHAEVLREAEATLAEQRRLYYPMPGRGER